MEGTGFLRTVRVGGFDKKDVLAYVDELNTKIYTLEAELEEKNTLMKDSASDGGQGGSNVDVSKYEKLLEIDKARITELQTENSSLKNQMLSLKDDAKDLTDKVNELKKKNIALESDLEAAKNKAATAPAPVSNADEDAAMDLSNVFLEAQKTANSIVMQAKEKSKKLNDDAKTLADQIVDDANNQASTIVKTAEDKATKLVTDAENKSNEMKEATTKLKTVIADEVVALDTNIRDLENVLQMFSNKSLARIANATSVIDKAKDALSKGEIPIVLPSKPISRNPVQQNAPNKNIPNQPNQPNQQNPNNNKNTPAPAAAAATPAPKASPAAANVSSSAATPPPPPAAPRATGLPLPKKPMHITPPIVPPSSAGTATPAAAPAPAAPLPKKPYNKFAFDMSELENLTKAAEAAEAQDN